MGTKPRRGASYPSGKLFELGQIIIFFDHLPQMHRARMLHFSISPNYDWYHPRIRFVRVPRSSLDLLGPFEQTIRRLAEQAADACGRVLPSDESRVLMPVHELQIENIISKFNDVEVLHPDISVEALAQSSIRSVHYTSIIFVINNAFQDCGHPRSSWDGSQTGCRC